MTVKLCFTVALFVQLCSILFYYIFFSTLSLSHSLPLSPVSSLFDEHCCVTISNSLHLWGGWWGTRRSAETMSHYSIVLLCFSSLSPLRDALRSILQFNTLRIDFRT